MSRRQMDYQPPFIWFGGKSPVANLIWEALGDPYNYVEPFAGSAAALFLRTKIGHVETINDADGFIVNFWRAMKADSDAVAQHADNMVNEPDLHAFHLWLVGQRESLTDRLCGDADFYDAKAAGWWVYGLNCWIGSGWCSGRGPWISENGRMTLRNTGQGVNRKLPHLGNTGQGVNRKLPHLGDTGKGVNRKLPHLGDTGKGVNRQLPHLGDTGKGVNRQLPHLGNTGQGGESATPAPGRHGEGRQPETPSQIDARREWLTSYLRAIADRLRNVRVCCGDWSRVCGPSVTFRHGPTGVFLDPPYADSAQRTEGLYAVDCQQVAHEVREWAIEQGRNKLMRIVLAGYEGEHAMPDDWRVIEWKAVGGYGLGGDEDSKGRKNRGRERLWCSPHCEQPRQRDLFGDRAAMKTE